MSSLLLLWLLLRHLTSFDIFPPEGKNLKKPSLSGEEDKGARDLAELQLQGRELAQGFLPGS